MPIKYLKSPVASSALNTETIGPILANLELINRALTISNTMISMSGVTNAGALVVGGGVGIGGNLNVGQNIYSAGNISAYDAALSNSITVTGHISAYDLNFSGSLVGDNGSFVLIQTDEIQASESVFSNLTVTDTSTLNRVTATTGTITTLTSTSATTTNLTAATTLSTLLRVDTITPRSGSQINLGSLANIRIAGGQSGYVLGTDGNGNLSWLVGPAGLTYANGIERVVNTVGLTTTGITAGTYNRVTVDQFGRITAGVLRPDETLDSVAARNAETSQQIYFTNTTESTDTETGAVIISGGLGVAGTINAAKLTAANIDVTNTLRVLDNLEITKTLNLTSGSNFSVPVKFSTTNLIDSPVVGAIEFDGNFFYITTLTGRQVLQTRESSDPITGTTNVRAVALYSIDLANPNQLITVSGNLVNAWDNVILNVNDRVLLSNQTSSAENGIYIWRGNGVALERAGDFNTLTGVFSGTIIFVTEGALYANGIFQIVTPNPITVGTTPLSIIETVNKNITGITNLTKDAVPGLLVKTSYGNYSLRNLVSNVSWLSITNPAGQAGNITINASTIPVSAGGTGRTNIWGYLRGSGSSILSSNTVPVSHISGIGTIATQNANAVSITGGNITVTDITANNNANIGGNLSAGNITTTGTVTTQNLSVSNITVAGGVSLPGLFGNAIALGANSAGSLSTNAISVSTTYNVTDTIALMNVVLGKLVPPPPPAFPGGQSISISGLTTARMADFSQTDNTATGGKNVAAGTTVTKIRRSSSYSTNSITTVGPGDTGNVSVYKNGTLAGFKQMVGAGNGTFNDLIIANNQDYNNVVSSVNPNFWFSFNASAAGTVAAGWNEVYIVHTAADSTNTTDWYYDSSTPGTPAFSSTSINVDSNVSIFSSTIPHYTTNTRFNLQFAINRLSGDTYPTSDTVITGTAGGAFDAPQSLSYSQAGISTPLARNLYVASGSASAVTYANIRSGFSSSSSGPSLSCSNSYNTGTQTFNPGVTILYKTGTSNQIEETSVPVNSVGTGSGNAVRIINPGSTDTPSFSASASAFNSQTSTLTATDATVVAAVLKHDVTNYSTGYLPVGPNLSTGRSGAQYFTFKFTRTVVSKFDVKYSGTIAGLWVALPGSSIDTTSTLNGWVTLDTAYNGSGIPGAGAGGNGNNGAAVGGVAVLNSAQTNRRVTATFGTASSSSTATNEIYVRIKLTSGQTVTALSIEAASN